MENDSKLFAMSSGSTQGTPRGVLALVEESGPAKDRPPRRTSRPVFSKSFLACGRDTRR
jgi:hypothetical protein